MTTAPLETPLLTPAEEKRAARELSPPIAWPTIAMAVILPLTQWSTVALGFARILPFWVCVPVITVVSYAHYTLVHESIHGNLAPGHPKLRWLNTLVGWIGALGLTFNWPVMMRSHVLHHAHTNTDADPDIEVKGTFGRLLVRWMLRSVITLIPLFLLKYVLPKQGRRIDAMLQRGEALQASAAAVGVLALLAAAIAGGRAADWLFLLFVPTRLATLMLGVFFSWLPHYPFDRTERYLNTRISLWPGGTILLLQQNLHLMHHLWPSVPFYNYARLYRRLRPVLIAKGSPIQGLLVGPYARDLSQEAR